MNSGLFLKTLLFSLFILFSTSIMNAQFKLGVMTGINFASQSVSNDIPGLETNTKAGLFVGAVADYTVIKNLSVRCIASYIQRRTESTLMGRNAEIIYDYLVLSPLVTYTIFDIGVSAKILGGFSYGYLIKGVGKVEGSSPDADLTETTENYNITTDIGLEVELPISKNLSLTLDGIYSLGLNNISKVGTNSLKTRDIILGIGFKYELFN